MLRDEAAGDEARVAAVLAGVRRYQQAPRRPRTAMPVEFARAGRARLLDHGGGGVPLVLVPSLINGPEILDLDAERSLARWLAGQGLRTLLVDWGAPTSGEAGLDLGGHVERLLLPLLASLPEPPAIVGYCLGGTLATAAAALGRVRALATIASPWRFAGYPDTAREALTGLWQAIEPQAFALGLLPMEMLQIAFWRLDPSHTLGKYAAFGRRTAAGGEQAFVAVEDWANGGPALTYAAARELVEDLFGEDRPGAGRWRPGGACVSPDTLDLPMLEIVSTTDRIVPAAAAAGRGRRLALDLGHVGMIVGGRAKEALWAPLAEWLRTV